MLIRSQDKTILVNVDNAFNIVIRDINGAAAIYAGSSSSCCNIAEYSTKAKAMKVLDMIQKAYADFEASKITSTGLVIATYTGSCDTPESAACGIKALKGYVEMIRESVIFQMPEDSEVEV